MNRVFIICATWALLLSIAPGARAQNNPPLRQVQSIAMPNVKGRIDHMDVDLEGKRLFVAGIERNVGSSGFKRREMDAEHNRVQDTYGNVLCPRSQ
jgi:hypothetical protein